MEDKFKCIKLSKSYILKWKIALRADKINKTLSYLHIFTQELIKMRKRKLVNPLVFFFIFLKSAQDDLENVFISL